MISIHRKAKADTENERVIGWAIIKVVKQKESLS